MTINVDLTQAKAAKHHIVCALVYDDLCTFEYGIAVEVFGRPRPEFDSWYEFRTVAAEPGPLRAMGTIYRHLLTQLLLLYPAGITWMNPSQTI